MCSWRIVTDVPDGIRDFCVAFLDGLSAVLGRNLYGVYLFGGWAFPEGTARGDVDAHVVVRGAPGDAEKAALAELHARLAQEYPSLAGEGLDAYYILLDDARGTAPPGDQLSDDIVDSSWALHRAHIRAGRCIVLYGPDPTELYPAASWDEIETALQGELDYVAKHLADHPAYCVLNLCRLMYSFDTHDVVVSKHASAVWACDKHPDRRSFIQAASHDYEGSATTAEVHVLKAGAADFFGFARKRIGESRTISGAA